MAIKRRSLLVAVLLVAVVTTGCFGPGENQATTEAEGETETTPADTVEAGGQPTAEPDQTPTMFGTTTGQGTANGTGTTANATG